MPLRVEVIARSLVVRAMLMSAGGRARAEETRGALDLAWAAPEGCPTEAHVRAEVARYLGRQLEGFANAVAARAVVANDPRDRWRVDLTTTFRGQVHARTIEGDSCSSVADAVALVLAFKIDPERAASNMGANVISNANAVSSANVVTNANAVANASAAAADSRPPPTVNEPASTSPPLAVDVESSSSTRTPRTQPRPWTLRLATGADSAALPAVTGFVALSMGRAFGAASLEGTLAYYFPRTRAIEGSPATTGGKFDLATAALRGCYALATSGVELGPCIGAEVGTLRGTGFGVGEPGEGKGLWFAATAGGLARWHVAPWFGAIAEAGVALPWFRPDYVIDNVGSVYRTNFIAFRGLAGIEAYF